MRNTKRCANGHHTLIFNINERIPDNYLETNKTIADWSIQLQADPSWPFYMIGSTLVAKVNGQEVYNQYAKRSCDGGSIVTWASGSTEVDHEPDGKKTISFECSYTQNSTANWTPGNAILNGNLVLTTIPRATVCPVLSGDVESTYNIALNPASKDFKHSMKVVFGNISGYINASGNIQTTEYKFSNVNINFMIPGSFYQQFSGKSGTGELQLTTYSGDNAIGLKKSKLTANCLESRCRPSINGTVVDFNPDTLSLTGNEKSLIKGYSNAKLTLDLEASSTEWDTKSSIQSRNVDGIPFNGTTVILNKVSKKDFTVNVTNSRGYGTSKLVNAVGNLIDYFSPSINVSFYRANQTSSNVKLNYSGSFFNQSFGSVMNNITLKWYWKKSTDSSWTLGGTIVPIINGNNISSATIDCGSNYDYQTNYRFKLEAVDKLSNGNKEMDVTAGVPNYSHGKNWFQHHTKIYDLNDNEILSRIDLSKQLFPVGAVYVTTNNVNPQTFLGGTWQSFGQGRTLVGVNVAETEFNTALKTGGEKINSQLNCGDSHYGFLMKDDTGYIDRTIVRKTPLSRDHGEISAQISNLQPYITVYFWRRTA